MPDIADQVDHYYERNEDTADAPLHFCQYCMPQGGEIQRQRYGTLTKQHGCVCIECYLWMEDHNTLGWVS
jgi:hypothetical protein